jgi:hypothetical protein
VRGIYGVRMSNIVVRERTYVTGVSSSEICDLQYRYRILKIFMFLHVLCANFWFPKNFFGFNCSSKSKLRKFSFFLKLSNLFNFQKNPYLEAYQKYSCHNILSLHFTTLSITPHNTKRQLVSKNERKALIIRLPFQSLIQLSLPSHAMTQQHF